MWVFLKQYRTYILKTFGILQNLITIQEELYKQYEARPRQSSTLDEMKAQLDKMEAEIEEMKPEIDSMKNFKHFDTVTFNGIVEIKSDGIFEEVYVENIKGTKTNTVIKDIVL
jgi:Tfp pilus assembly protein PilO